LAEDGELASQPPFKDRSVFEADPVRLPGSSSKEQQSPNKLEYSSSLFDYPVATRLSSPVVRDFFHELDWNPSHAIAWRTNKEFNPARVVLEASLRGGA